MSWDSRRVLWSGSHIWDIMYTSFMYVFVFEDMIGIPQTFNQQHQQHTTLTTLIINLKFITLYVNIVTLSRERRKRREE